MESAVPAVSENLMQRMLQNKLCGFQARVPPAAAERPVVPVAVLLTDQPSVDGAQTACVGLIVIYPAERIKAHTQSH